MNRVVHDRISFPGLRAALAGLAVGMALVLAGCAEASGAALDNLRARHEAAGGAQAFVTLADLTSSRRYVVVAGSSAKSGPERPLTDSVLVGTIDEVRPGAAFAVDEAKAPDGVKVDFDDPDALWRTVHLMVTPSSVISGSVPPGQVRVGVAFDAEIPLDAIRRDLLEFGPVLLFLNRTPVFRYDPTVYGTVDDGVLLGKVAPSGAITLPLMGADEAVRLLRGCGTVNELRAAARAQVRTIRLDGTGARATP